MKKTYQNNLKQCVAISTQLSIITLNVCGLDAPIKHRVYRHLMECNKAIEKE